MKNGIFFVSVVLYFLFVCLFSFSSMVYLCYLYKALLCGHIPDANVPEYKGMQIKQEANYTIVSIFCSLLLFHF